MGNKNNKSSLRNAIIYLNISAEPISANDDKFWSQIFTEEMSLADDVIKNITVQEVRILRDGAPKNFATLAYKMVECLYLATGSLCNTHSQQTAVLNATKILIRMIPCIFEDRAWRHFFDDNMIDLAGKHDLKYPVKNASERNYNLYLPKKDGSRPATPMIETNSDESCWPREEKEPLIGERLLSADLIEVTEESSLLGESTRANHDQNRNCDEKSLMKVLVLSICDLLFCPEFTVLPHSSAYLSNAIDGPPEDLKSLSTHDYVWEPGVGFDSNINSTTYYDKNRSALLRALLVCLSVTLYERPEKSTWSKNKWMEIFVSENNRHALPLFTSLLNIVFSYNPSRPILQFNNFLNDGSRERLVELAAHLLIASLNYQMEEIETSRKDSRRNRNLFIYYLSQIHRNEDFIFLNKGFTRLFNHGLEQGYIWPATKSIELEQELQLLFWKICNLNRKFMQFLLQSNEVTDIIVPILYHLNENFQEASKTALIHLGTFNLLLLSGERNFGVMLNKDYTTNLLGNLPEFSGTHVDLIVLVFHKLIMYGYGIHQLYDYLLTILVNISPYVKGMTLLASRCLIQLFETFSSPVVIFTEPNYHQLVIFLLEIFNNIIQYQFDGNSNLVYTILKRRDVFINLANLPTSQKTIDKVLKKLIKRKQVAIAVRNSDVAEQDLEGGLVNEQTTKQTESNVAEEESSLSMAVVSCYSQSNKGETVTKQEVSLVAIPALQQATSAIYPFDKTNTETNCASPVESSGKSPEREVRSNLDDIMNDLSECLLVQTDTCSVQSDVRTIEEGSSLMSQQDEKSIESRDSGSPLMTNRSNSSSNVNQRKKWKPTPDWLAQWKQTLPLHTVLRMISSLDPQVEQMKRSSTRAVSESDIIKFLQKGTLAGLIPVPHPILIKKYRTNHHSTVWFRTCTWGIIYVRGTTWTGTDVRLIKIL